VVLCCSGNSRTAGNQRVLKTAFRFTGGFGSQKAQIAVLTEAAAGAANNDVIVAPTIDQRYNFQFFV
jgi:hypothetical protein